MTQALPLAPGMLVSVYSARSLDGDVFAFVRQPVRASLAVALALTIFLTILAPGAAQARDHLVTDAQALRSAAAGAAPGDVVILANGEWRDVDLTFVARGSARRPITLRAQTPGGVIIAGRSSLNVAGRHLVVRDLLFRGGYPRGEAAIVSRVGRQWAEHVRFTGIVIHQFSNPDRRAIDHWVALYGRHIIVDRSHFEGKQNAGATFIVAREDGWPLDNRVRISRNYFGPRPPLGSNTGETIRVGTSENSLTDSMTVIEDNIFDRCSGEVEIVSIKSGGNIIRRNLFLRSQGSLVLRHGNGNLVEQNIFLGHGERNSGGIRVINRNQIVRGNYLEGLTGGNFTAALAVMNGVPNSAINRYHQVENARIHNNSFIDVGAIVLGAGASEERSAAPVNVMLGGNLVRSGESASPFRLLAPTTGFTFGDNIADQPPPAALAFRTAAMTMTRTANGLLYPTDPALARLGAPRTLEVPARDQVGPLWYRREEAVESGRQISVSTAGALIHALTSAVDGDTIDVGNHDLTVETPLPIRRAVTVTGTGARLAFRGATLFQIEEGGSLHLRGLTISGAQAPRVTGNAVIRTPNRSMLTNYMLSISDCRIEALNGAPGFDVIATTPGTLAALIRISDSDIADVSGQVLAASSERGPAGVYAAEAVTFTQVRLTRVGGVLDLLRDGTDESTFGPRLSFTGNLVVDSGPLLLNGAQESVITGNRFVRSAGVRVTHSVGDPRTEISGNSFDATEAPVITELYYRGPERAIVRENVQP